MHYLPASAYHASVYADWTDATFCRFPRATRPRSLTPAERSAATASAAIVVASQPPTWSIVDCHGDGAAAYYAPRYSLVPAYDGWQAAVIDAIRHLRRWRYYSDSAD